MVLSLLVGCHGSSSPAPVAGARLIVHTAGGSQTLTVQVADTPALREKGLMGVTSMAPDSGMAFVWTSPITSTFWMKDTLIPLSIAFWDAGGKVVAVSEMTPCTADPCKTYGAPVAYVGAVEANAGWFSAHGVKLGDAVELTR
jgi:uncharacterized membrane protein (UPF0127 family)